METFSFKISEKEYQALNTLANRWGCNRAESARRALQLAVDVTVSNAVTSFDPGKLKEIIEGQKHSSNLLIEMAKFAPLMARISRLEEYTVQACLSSGLIAKQAGLYEAAKIEYNAWKQKREGGI